MNLDPWQQEVLKTSGNMLLCSGRQTGKSTIISIRAGDEAIKNDKFSILIISSTERQSEELFQKCINYIHAKAPRLIKTGKDKPTKHIINLLNGSIIRCLPTGLAGSGIRGYTINLLIADEAAFIDDMVWSAVTPMLMTTGGSIWLVSTPNGRSGYFYDRYKDPNFKVFHVNSEQVIQERPISETWTEQQRQGALIHLEAEKKTMTQKQYAQEYLGQFVEDLTRFFPDELIRECCVGHRRGFYNADYYLGCDIARLGEDQTTFEIVERVDKDHYRHTESLCTMKTRITDTIKKVFELEKIYKFKGIYIDTGGVGGGVFDVLLDDDRTKRKVVSIDNAKRSLTRDKKRTTGILKEDLYNNLLVLMEQKMIHLLNDDDVILSLKSIQYEYIIKEGQPSRLQIWGSYSHIVEGIIRACWCNKEKGLNIWCASNGFGV